MFQSFIIDKDDHLLLKVEGDLDVYSEEKFRDFIEENLRDIDKDLTIDLEKLDYLDSTGLGQFMKIYRLVNEKGHKTTITNPKENIYKLFKITDLTEVFNME